MIKFLRSLVQIIFWLQAFAAPVLISGIIALLIYSGNDKNKWLSVIILIAGVATGVCFAEFIRRKHGLDTFFGRVNGSSEVDESLKK